MKKIRRKLKKRLKGERERAESNISDCLQSSEMGGIKERGEK
jgi:hypothetical protein